MSIFRKHKKKKKYVEHLKLKGVQIGTNFTIFGGENNILIDETRPSLVTIGDNVCVNKGFTLLTHDWVCAIFKEKYQDFLNSSGAVKIGNNVSFGINCTVLKGVTIGDNTFIAAGSVVTKDIPNNCVAGGIPAKVICSMDDYYEKRKIQSHDEALEYARSIAKRYKRRPIPSDFWEEFPWFVDKNNLEDYENLIPIKTQLGDSYEYWIQNHVAKYDSLDAFLAAAGISDESTNHK